MSHVVMAKRKQDFKTTTAITINSNAFSGGNSP